MIRKIKKVRRQRGSRTHGWGAGKKHRGAGHRGGKGFAGVGKRGGQKATVRFNAGERLGKHGMQIARHRPRYREINLYDIQTRLETWLSAKKIKKEKDAYLIDLSELGYDKVLSLGILNSKLKITAKAFSKPAEEKIKVAGGEAIKA